MHVEEADSFLRVLLSPHGLDLLLVLGGTVFFLGAVALRKMRA